MKLRLPVTTWPALLLLLAGCRGGAAPPRDAAAPPRPVLRYSHDLLFVAAPGAEPRILTLRFRATRGDSLRQRSVRGWLARGGTWEGFLRETWSGPAVGSVWTIVPHDDLHLAAGGPADVEAIWYRRGSRRLRLRIGEPLSGWAGGDRLRMRFLDGSLALAGESSPGTVLESLSDEPEPVAGARDRLFLVAGDSLWLAIDADSARTATFAELLEGTTERASERVTLSTSATTVVTAARRNVPTRWRFELPELGITGELRAVGAAADVGAERGGRRAVDANYTVAGWIERAGVRAEVTGVARHRAW
ncbi:MAG TPA: hypothetical protein VFL93_10570 [Longimicrobiaceae bacterium]|nr:hypothetical protein [Longimicrobiaceae bacterium]